MLGFYNYTVILTYVGMLLGFEGIGAAMNGDIQTALLCLIASGFCDMFDGKIASTMERTRNEKEFGIQIDSLSDLICFGVLPGIIVYQITGTALWLSGLYVLCALIRLAWFNVDEQERQQQTEEVRTGYLGLPVTTAAMIFPLLVGVARLFTLPLHVLAPLVMAATGMAFLTPFHLPKPRLAGKLGLLLCGSTELILLLMRR